MPVSTELLAVLVTVACGVMTINMVVMKLLWDDIKKVKGDHAAIREAMALNKADLLIHCRTYQGACKAELLAAICKKLEEVKKSIGEQWDRVNHHSHETDGSVVIKERKT